MRTISHKYCELKKEERNFSVVATKVKFVVITFRRSFRFEFFKLQSSSSSSPFKNYFSCFNVFRQCFLSSLFHNFIVGQQHLFHSSSSKNFPATVHALKTKNFYSSNNKNENEKQVVVRVYFLFFFVQFSLFMSCFQNSELYLISRMAKMNEIISSFSSSLDIKMLSNFVFCFCLQLKQKMKKKKTTKKKQKESLLHNKISCFIDHGVLTA